MDCGQYENVPFADYLAWAYPSQSTLKAALPPGSPAHLRAALDGEREVEVTDEMLLGSALHCGVLEPELMSRYVVCWDGGTRRGKDWEQFKAQHAGQIILTQGYYDRLVGITRAMRRHPLVKQIMSKVVNTELSVVGEIEGAKVKARIDANASDRIWDIKTCRSADMRLFAKSAMSLGYDVQAGMYYELMGCKPFGFIAVENTPPYDIGVFVPDDDFLNYGRNRMLMAVQIYVDCKQTGNWPGRYSEPQPLRLPEWALDDGEEITLDGEVAYGGR